VCVESGDLQSVLDAVERLSAEREGLRDCLLGIALSDRYRSYPKQHEDGGVRGQSGLRAVRALTGKHGSYLSDDEVVQLDKEARAALTQGESRQTGAGEDLRVPGGYRGPSSSGPVTPPSGGSSIVHPGDETNPDKWDMGRLR
jgi:hypothetical protein